MERTRLNPEVFLDASYAIALSAPTDQHHSRAVAIAQRLETERTGLVTTRAVMLEIGNALSKPRYRQAAVALREALERDASVEIVPLSEPLY